jgi:multiple sugar transport system substrate-binding protein
MKKIQNPVSTTRQNLPVSAQKAETGQLCLPILRKNILFGIFFLLIGILIFSACSFDLNSIRSVFTASTVTPEKHNPDITPTALTELQLTETVVPQDIHEITSQHVLTLWLPPQFDPKNGTVAGNLLKKQLDAFMTEYPNVQINVRIKAASGPGGLLESLTTTSAAAPDALPTLILLNRSSLETASFKGLIFPLDEISTVIDDADWYEYARELAIIQGSVYGLPFAGDAILLVYRPSQFSSIPKDWETLQNLHQPVLFPAADTEGLLTLTLYKSLGAPIQDTQLRPTLDVEQLELVFKLYEDGARNGVFTPSITQYQTESQVWQAYTEQSANAVITWSSRYLNELPADSSAVPLPVLGNEMYTVADGWMWALADTNEERKVLGAALAEYLVDENFLAEWSPNTDYLPTRPTSLAAVTNQNLKSLLSQIVIASHVRPATDLTSTIGPIVQEGTLQIIKRQLNSVDAAIAAADKLETPAQ